MAAVKTTGFTRVASTDEIPPGIMRKVSVDDRDVVLANVDVSFTQLETCALTRKVRWTKEDWTTMRLSVHGMAHVSTSGPDI